jgi:hypothetical protein
MRIGLIRGETHVLFSAVTGLRRCVRLFYAPVPFYEGGNGCYSEAVSSKRSWPVFSHPPEPDPYRPTKEVSHG